MKAVIAKRNRWSTRVRQASAWLCLAALWMSLVPFAALAADNPKSKTARLTEEQRILHVLNRFGFGARPGDVARVRQMGLDKYMEQQLNPSRIPDPIADAKVQSLEVLQMSTSDLFAKYPNPGALLQMLQRSGQLPANLATAKETRQEAKANKGNDTTAMPAPDTMPAAPAQPQANQMDNAEMRRTVAAYYLEHGLKQPNLINRELIASRLLRAAYSERQLQEVMVDFWTNHFNVFINKNAVRWLLPAYDRDTIRPNALGNFKDLLLATAQSPAMLFYLDNFQSVAPNQGNNLRQQQRRNNQIGGTPRNNGGLGGIFGGAPQRRRQQLPQNGAGQPDMRARSNPRPSLTNSVRNAASTKITPVN